MIFVAMFEHRERSHRDYPLHLQQVSAPGHARSHHGFHCASSGGRADLLFDLVDCFYRCLSGSSCLYPLSELLLSRLEL